MIVQDLQLQRLTLTLRTPLRTASGEFRLREGVRLRLSTGEQAGLGEAMPLPSFGTERPERALHAVLHGAQALVGAELPEDPAGLDAALDAVAELAEAPAARHAVECALLDLAARRAGVPVRRLLRRGATDRLRVNALLSAQEPRALAEEARRAVAAGFEVLKLKVGVGELEHDARRLEAVREAVGSRVLLRLDANGAWAEVDAASNLRRLGELGVELCEQPVRQQALGALRGLRGAVPCLIAADEAAATQEGARAVLDGGAGPAADVLVLRPMVQGGLWRTLQLARAAHELGLGAYVATSLDGLVARAAACQVAAALPGAQLAHGLGTAALFEEDEGPAYAPQRGWVELPGVPGLGLAGGIP